MPSPFQLRALLSGQALSPLKVPNLGLWLSPLSVLNAGGTAAADSDLVATANDLSGNNRTFAQATSSKRPALNNAGINGRPGLLFDAVDDLLSASTGLDLVQNVSGATIYAVGRGLTGTVSSFEHILASRNNGTAVRTGLSCLATNTYRASGRRLDADSLVSAAGGTTSTAPFILTGAFDYSGTKLSLYLNDTLLTTTDPFQTAGSTSNTASAGIHWGADGVNVSTFNGFLGDVLVWPRLNTRLEISYVNKYLKQKYGL